MKTETVNRIQDLVSRDAGLGTRVEAMLAAAQKTTPVGRGRSQSEPSLVLFVRRRALINFQVPRSPFAPVEHRSLDLLSVSDHPVSRNQHHIFCPHLSAIAQIHPSYFCLHLFSKMPLPNFPFLSFRFRSQAHGKAAPAQARPRKPPKKKRLQALPARLPSPAPRQRLNLSRERPLCSAL
jgi:hypothetical protein